MHSCRCCLRLVDRGLRGHVPARPECITPRIRFLFIALRFRLGLPLHLASRRRTCPLASLRLYKPGTGTFTRLDSCHARHTREGHRRCAALSRSVRWTAGLVLQGSLLSISWRIAIASRCVPYAHRARWMGWVRCKRIKHLHCDIELRQWEPTVVSCCFCSHTVCCQFVSWDWNVGWMNNMPKIMVGTFVCIREYIKCPRRLSKCGCIYDDCRATVDDGCHSRLISWPCVVHYLIAQRIYTEDRQRPYLNRRTNRHLRMARQKQLTKK